MARTGIHYGKKTLRGDNTVNIQGSIRVIGFFLHLIAIYLYTEFYLNSNISLKLFAVQDTGWTDGRTKRRLYAPPVGEHTNETSDNTCKIHVNYL